MHANSLPALLIGDLLHGEMRHQCREAAAIRNGIDDALADEVAWEPQSTITSASGHTHETAVQAVHHPTLERPPFGGPQTSLSQALQPRFHPVPQHNKEQQVIGAWPETSAG